DHLVASHGTTRYPPAAVLLPVDLPPHRQQIGKAAMAFREVHVYEIGEVLRVWLRGLVSQGASLISGPFRRRSPIPRR
ncbi:MAG: hypothetical protein JWM85_1078, partial [Acidimicrobiaceae bacterium]|nr:hypothetical protein [Acidimicrobiaceae bacterium]